MNRKPTKLIYAILLMCFCWIPVKADWERTSGFFNVSTRSFAVSGSAIFAATSTNTYSLAGNPTFGYGIFKSSDNGLTWQEKNNGLTEKRINCIAAESVNVYAGTANGVFFSSNGGDSWTPVNTGISSLSIRDLAIKGTTVFAGTDNVIYRSVNNGTSWSVARSLSPEYFRSFYIQGSVIYALTEKNVYYSADDGITWTKMPASIPFSTFFGTYSYQMTISNGNIFVGTSKGVYSSADNGASWTEVNTGLPGDVVTGTITNIDSTLFIGTSSYGVFKSTDKGASWQTVNNGLTDKTINFLIARGNNLFAATFYHGIYTSSDKGSSWKDTNKGLQAGGARDITGNSTALFGASPFGIYISKDNGRYWSCTQTDSYANFYSLTSLNNKIFAGSNRGIFITSDNGVSWTQSNAGLADTMINTLTVLGSTLFAGTNNGVYRSTDQGATWTIVNSGLPSFTIVNCFGSAGTVLFAATEKGLYSTSNNGTLWAKVGTNSYTEIRSLAVINSSTIIMSKYMDETYKTTNGGASWSSIKVGFSNIDSRSLLYSSGKLYASTFFGVYSSTDEGVTWKDENENSSIGRFYVNGSEILGTSGDGVIIGNLSSSIDKISGEDDIILYPNPSNGSFTLSNPGRIKDAEIIISNILGETVFIKKAGDLAGDLLISLKDQAQGTYILQLRTKTGSLTKKIVLH